MPMRTEVLGGLNCRIVDADSTVPPRLLVVLCHGFGAPGTDLVPVGGELARLIGPTAAGIRFLFPAAPLSLDDYGLPGGRAWWPLDMAKLQAAIEFGETRDLRNESPELLPQARDALTAAVTAGCAEAGLPFSRCVLGGFSQGSMVATDVALHLAERPAALVIWSGTLLCEAVWRAASARLSGLPVLISHGRYDQILPYSNAECLRLMLAEAGCDVQFLPFNGMHEIPQSVLRATADLLRGLQADQPQ